MKELQMDYTLESPEERAVLAQKIIDSTPSEKLTPYFLTKLSDYVILALDKQEKKEKKILTDNRLVTVNRRETSYEGLVDKIASKSESGNGGADSIYHMIANDKDIIFSHKVSITEGDIAEVPGLRELREAIAEVEKMAKTARGRRAFLLKKQLIEMHQDQYVLKGMFKQPIRCTNLIKSFSKLDLSEDIGLDEKDEVYSTGIVNLYNPAHISALFSNYSKLKEDTWSDFSSDAKWILMDLENLVEKVFKDKYPLYYDLIIYKIDGKTNEEIRSLLFEKYQIKHSEEYLSSLWRNKIPKMIARQAADDWLEWHFTFEEKGKWKKCNKCGQIKLAHNHFFSKNKTSKDGWYSVCKECRNKAYAESKKG